MGQSVIGQMRFGFLQGCLRFNYRVIKKLNVLQTGKAVLMEKGNKNKLQTEPQIGEIHQQ